MTNAELFLDKYKKLERTVRVVYKLKASDSVMQFLERQESMSQFRADYDYCRQVRNFLTHNEKVSGEFAVDPNPAMLDFLDDMYRRVIKRVKCSRICVKRKNVYFRRPEDLVKPALAVMLKRGFSHVPILVDGIVKGMLDENALFTSLAVNGSMSIGESLLVKDLAEYTGLEGRDSEDFIFHPYDSYADELEQRFNEATRRGRRIGMALLTETGDPEENLKGIITPWDLIKA